MAQFGWDLPASTVTRTETTITVTARLAAGASRMLTKTLADKGGRVSAFVAGPDGRERAGECTVLVNGDVLTVTFTASPTGKVRGLLVEGRWVREGAEAALSAVGLAVTVPTTKPGEPAIGDASRAALVEASTRHADRVRRAVEVERAYGPSPDAA